MEKIEIILSENLRSKRKELKLSQEALAERAGVSMFTVQAYESGRRWPELPTLHKISEALGVSTSELFQSQSRSIPTNQEILHYLAENLGYEVKKKS